MGFEGLGSGVRGYYIQGMRLFDPRYEEGIRSGYEGIRSGV